MKVLSINGFTKSGKTTTAENIIQELKKRGFSVGSVKEIHYEAFKIDTEGTNTDRHRKAGASLVTARGIYETDILFKEMLPIDKILSFYDHDYVILEGVNDINAPKIITAHNTEEIDERIDYRTLLVSGVIAKELREYRGFEVINCITETERLVDKIEETVPDLLPDFDPECCGACGYDCHALLSGIISGQRKREDCVVGNADIRLKVGGEDVKMVPFVQNILRNAVIGIVKELRGYMDGAAVEISIGNKK
ncbi:MAG: molybdopterin-guanine dinucleotide biosynthesis protein B [Christensenellales bacterium]|jgi:molybdopterin-guanine dinucleotide biosynthesis protein B